MDEKRNFVDIFFVFDVLYCVVKIVICILIIVVIMVIVIGNCNLIEGIGINKNFSI